ncbi:response regulator transcription factor [Phenylobacterium montanum]|uniref:Response regulator n=1 Tax=Phenylobacterium montanum TaxID=2823693 RepID=A0A975FWT9_9CAUL|nr:response regulator [Caulobacter sp. S6]QUD86938.1 response regulator [Caulobacter sp. S6]
MAQVLIAEDEAFTAMALVDALADQGHTVRDAADGAIAIRMLDDFEADLVITDLMMPNLDGAGLIRFLDSRPGPQMPVILISGVPETRLPADLRYDAYVGKPIDHAALTRAIDALTQPD